MFRRAARILFKILFVPWENVPSSETSLRNMMEIMMAQQDDIKAALDKVREDVAAQTTVVQGMSTYVAGIQKQLVDMANATKDTETAGALMSLAQQIESNTKSDADAMAANLTGITPAPPVTPPPKPNPFVDPNAPAVQPNT